MTSKSASHGIGQLLRVLRAHDAEGHDGQLLERFLVHHDEVAFKTLVRRHGPMVLGVCRRILGNDADSEDAFQATFLVLLRKASALTSRSILGDWLHGVARHTALKARAAATRREAKEQAMARPDVTGEEVRNDWLPLLDEELARLPEKCRLPIVLCDLEGRTRREAAEQLSWPEGTVAGRLAQARTMLAKGLARHGVVFSGGALAVALAQNAASAGVPASLVWSTVKAAASIAAGNAVATAIVSAKVAILTEGVLKTMLLSKLKSTAAVMLVAVLGVLGLAMLPTRNAEAVAQAAPGKDAKPVDPVRADKAVSDTEKLQGVWNVTEVVLDGETKPLPAGLTGRLVIEGDEFRLVFSTEAAVNLGGGQSMSLVYATFKLNSATSPWNIDLAVSKKAKNKLWLGIYELDGDNLRLCLPEVAPFDQRPIEFKAGKGSNLKVLKLKRNDDVVKKELQRLAGTWRAVAVELGGKEPDVEIGPNNLLVISGTKLSFVTGEKKRTIECTFTIDPTKKPMWIDVTRTSDKVTWHGIYELEGDKLKLFQSTPGKRPTEFKTKEGTQEVIHTHERVNEAKEPEAPAGQDLRDQTALAEKQATIKRAAVKVVEAQKAKAQARLSTTKAQVTQAKAAESLAEMQVERFKKLFDERSIEESSLNEQRTKLEAAKAHRGTVEAQVAEAESQVAIEQARILQAELEYEEAELRAKLLKARLGLGQSHRRRGAQRTLRNDNLGLCRELGLLGGLAYFSFVDRREAVIFC